MNEDVKKQFFMRLYFIKDRLTEECSPIFEANNDYDASRYFYDDLKGSRLHFSECELFYVGRYYKYDGHIEIEQPQKVYTESFDVAQRYAQETGLEVKK